MLSRSFIERVLLLIIGSYISFYFGNKLLNETLQTEKLDKSLKENLQKKLNIKLDLNYYEELLLTNIIDPELLKVNLDDIIGHEEVKCKIKNYVIKPLENPELYKKNKLLSPPNGIILYGPPGTGKTMLAKSIAKSINARFLNFNLSTIENKMYGETSKILQALFTLANKIKPVIIFIDEMDGSFSERNALDQSFVNNFKTQMLSFMDGIHDKDSSIIFIGATNKLYYIDPAIKRRMRLHINVPLPSDNERINMFEYYLKDFNIEFEENKKDEIIKLTKQLSGSDIYEICKICAHECFINNCVLTNDMIIDSIKVF